MNDILPGIGIARHCATNDQIDNLGVFQPWLPECANRLEAQPQQHSRDTCVWREKFLD